MITPLDTAWQVYTLDRIGDKFQLQIVQLCERPDATAGKAIAGVLFACCAIGLTINCLLLAALARGAFRTTTTAALLAWTAIVDAASLLTICLPLATTTIITWSARDLHLCRALPYLQLSTHSCQAGAYCLLVIERLLGNCRRQSRCCLATSLIISAVLLIIHLPMLPDLALVPILPKSNSVAIVNSGSIVLSNNQSLECLLTPNSNMYNWLAFVIQLALPALLAILLCGKLAFSTVMGAAVSNGLNNGVGTDNDTRLIGDATTVETWSDQLALTGIISYSVFHMPITALRFVIFESAQLPQWKLHLQLPQVGSAICAVAIATSLASIIRPCFQPLFYLITCPVFRRDLRNSLCHCRGGRHLQPKDSVMVMRSRLDLR
ncbi:hypothetical protein BOX15_Mlig019949g1 [Macrostomum lignano]|uniref:G_PROTEIN_RECEP_F1_2 domain-containing protein n=1 Tax=Macrostomum lignano TaxID=282301 RepID=A0A267EGX6_9PLAT|nr:hypothetical protein BOX15_Mlig019949g1 [Macrostomum lignano]